MRKTTSSQQEWLSYWREDLLRGSNKDPLVDLKTSVDKWIALEHPEDQSLAADVKIKKIIGEQQDLYKNAGVNVLCLIREVLHWNDDKQAYITPIYLSEVEFSWDKIHQAVKLSIAEDYFLNPFLEKMFASKFETGLEEWLTQHDLPESWSRNSTAILGNFHYHRFALLRDFDTLESMTLHDSSLGYYLQERPNERIELYKTEEAFIFPMDVDQTRVFSEVAAGNPLVVEGPPGSGKSQVLANLLFQAAQKEHRVVLCSEKKTALDVVESKLTSKGLGAFCLNLTSSKQGKTALVRSLQESWQLFEKKAAQDKDVVPEMRFFKQKRDALELKLERLSHFPKLNSQVEQPPFTLSVYPDKKDFEKYKIKLYALNQKYELLATKSLNHSCFIFFKPFIFGSDQTVKHVLQNVQTARATLLKCQAFLGDEIALKTHAELENVQRVLIHAQLLSQPLFSKNPDLFVAGSKAYKKFQASYEKYLVSKQALELHENQEGFKWQNPWSRQELMAAKKSFSEDRFWQLDFRRWKKQFIKSYQPEVFTRDLALQAIDSCLEVHEVMLQHQKCLDEFYKLGIHHPELDLPLILQLQRSVNQNTVGLQKTQTIYNSDFLARLLSIQSDLQEIIRFVNHHFMHLGERTIVEVFNRILEENDFLLGQCEAIFELLNLEPKLPRFLPDIQDFCALEQAVLCGAIQKFKTHNPELFHYSAEDLLGDISQLIVEENRHFELQIEAFWRAKVQQFVAFHTLITAPTNKLSDSEKALRKKLKSGRSLLVKEFNKSRQHKSIRELLSSDAAPWIHLLKPILLFNPLAIAQVFPQVSGCIDLLLFDEASQIPFAHAIPAIFRAKQIAIFGDSQQLSPSAYFLQGSAQRADLLSESRHFLSCDALNFHYRCRHPSLIAFSNRYFYGNRLEVLPSRSDANCDGMFCHFVEKAVYSSGENRDEALALVHHLNAAIGNSDAHEQIGVVAFSEKQLAIIESLIRDLGNAAISDAQARDRLILTTIEKVQGDEFDLLYVSLGYGKDASGTFALRFGPVNQEGGEKRLNVLFTRARRALHFFHSVHADDFGHADNLGVQALKNFLLMHEKSPYEFREKPTDALEIWDPFYDPAAVSRLMTLVRHASWSGLPVTIRFWKDACDG